MIAAFANLATLTDTATLGGGFTLIDWLVVLAVLVAITIAGERLAGKQETVRDFYLGGRRLPWIAVSASIIATEISAVTFFAVPSQVWGENGNIQYLQIGVISAVLARCFIAWLLIPAYYEREVYSPYEYMGNQLGSGVRKMTTCLFMIGGVLAQASRVYITAVVIEVLAQEQLAAVGNVIGLPPLGCAIAAIGVVALAWTWLGGVATVVWTDAFLFVLFLAGMITMALFLHGGIDGGLPAALDSAQASGRLGLVDTDFAFTKPYTLVAVVFAASWGLVGPYGTDQLIVQRLLCCKDVRDARKAMVTSSLAFVVIALALLIGVGLVGYYATHSMSPAGAAMVAETPARVLPVFVREALPVGVRGLVLAGAFAAAISSLDSILAALGQTTLSTFWTPWSEKRRARRGLPRLTEDEASRAGLRTGRLLVILWSVVLAAVAMGMEVLARQTDSLLDLALSMSAFIGGPLLAAFLLGWMPSDPNRSPRLGAAGFLWAAPLGVLTVLFSFWHGATAYAASWWIVSIIFLLWLVTGLPRRRQPYGAIQSLWYGFSLFLITRLAEVGDFPDGRSLAWTWYVPVGSTVTFVYSLLLDKHRQN